MDERSAARRPNLELVKNEPNAGASGTVPTTGEQAAGTGLTPGILIEGKYRVGRVIGSGAVGMVHEATNVELDETVAIKCLRPEMLVDKGMVARFAREAKAAAAIKSEYVATVHDVGTTSSGVPYIVMEYLEGKDLGSVVAELGTLGPRTAVEYALQCCEALAVAHSKGIVHRDIKPENLLLTERAGGMRIVKVLDFGISKTALTGSIFKSELPLVKTINLMGTPLYMSPEQVRASDSVDVRSDIWSLGMVIYEVLTGDTAFTGSSITEICAAILESAPKPIEDYRTDLPPALVEVIMRCLQKDAANRYQTIADLALALMPFGPKRTRLNVERAVAVLQGAGQLDANVRVSTIPPSPSDFSLTPIPRAPSVPGNLASAGNTGPASGTSGVGTGSYTQRTSTVAMAHSTSAPPSRHPDVGPPSPADVAYPERRKPVGLIVGIVAAVLLAVVALAVATRSEPHATTRAGTTTTATTAIPSPLTPAPPPPAAAPAIPPATTTAVATTAAPSPSGPRVFPWGAPVRPGAAHLPGTKPAMALPSSVVPAVAPPQAPSAAAKTKPTGEPDLGY